MHGSSKVVLICTSPKAGSGANQDLVPRLVESLSERGVEALVSNDIAEVACKAAEFNQQGRLICVLAAGGDGTLSLVASRVPKGVPVMPLPMGTENLVARYVGQEASVEAAVATIMSGKSTWLDAGMANERMFLIMCSAGFDAEVVRRLDESRRGHIRKLSYLWPIVMSIVRYAFPRINLVVDDDGLDAPVRWSFAFNLPRYGGGLAICEGAKGDDGMLNVVGFRKGKLLGGFRYIWHVLRRKHLQLPDVTNREAATVRMEPSNEGDRIPYQLDGDFAGYLPVTVSLLPRHFRLLVPPECPNAFAYDSDGAHARQAEVAMSEQTGVLSQG